MLFLLQDQRLVKIMTKDEFLDRLAYSRKQSLEGKVVNADEAVNHIRKNIMLLCQNNNSFFFTL